MWIHPQGDMNVGVRFHGKSVSFLQRDFTLNYTVPREEKGMNVCSRSGVSSNISVCTDRTITTSKTLTCWWSITKLFRIHPQYYNNPSSICQDMSAKTNLFGIIQIRRLHPLGTMNVCPKLHSNPLDTVFWPGPKQTYRHYCPQSRAAS